MAEVKWDAAKNEILKRTRGVSFEEMLQAKLLVIKKHPVRANQRIMVFEYGGYVWAVPCIRTEDEIFLKTLFPSRKYMRLYKEGKLHETD